MTANSPASAQQPLARAFCPGHITGFFMIRRQAVSPLHQGSLGAGFSIALGVLTEIRAREGGGLSINGTPAPEAQVSRWILREYSRVLQEDREGRGESLTPWAQKTLKDAPAKGTALLEETLGVQHTIDIPQGCGFGSSGAGAFSLALALEKLIYQKPERQRAAQMAHAAEVIHKTGLGTVAGQFTGGMELRLAPGAPGIGKTPSSPLPAQELQGVFCLQGPLSTAALLSDPQVTQRINKAGTRGLERLKDHPSPQLFLEESRHFAEEAQLIPPGFRPLLDRWDEMGVTGSPLMFGRGVFSLAASDKIEALRSAAHQLLEDPFQWLVSPPENQGGRWI